MTFPERMITNALAPIINANAGQLRARAIPEYVLVLIATGAFEGKAEIKQVFNELAWRGAFRLKGGK